MSTTFLSSRKLITASLGLFVAMSAACGAVPAANTPTEAPTVQARPTLSNPTPMPPTQEPPAGKLNPNINNLPDTNWNLIGYGQPDALTSPATDSRPTLDFTTERMSGSFGCNSFGGSYTVEGQNFKPGTLVSTMMACAEPLMAQETTLAALMEEVTSYQHTDIELTLIGPKGVLVYELAQNADLVGPTWQLAGLATADAVSTWTIDEKITLMFADGQATGFAGCNTYFGDYTQDGEALKFGLLGATQMFCEGEAGQREAELFAAFERVTAYTIVREQLSLLDADGKLVASFNAAKTTP